MVMISYPDGSKKEQKDGIKGIEIAELTSPSLAKKALVIEVNGKLKDLSEPINNDAEINIITMDDDKALPILRHSFAHLLAEAMTELYPDIKFAIGPSIENGFYYDYDFDKSISVDDLSKIEEKMKEIINRNEPIKREEVKREDAIKRFKDNKEPYKVENVEAIPEGEIVSLYSQGNFVDLCRGPHVISTGKLPKDGFKLTKVAGAYWKGDSNNKMLQRIYGTAWHNKQELDEHLKMLEEAEKRDHRKIGKVMDLFHFEPEYAPGSAFWHYNGLAIYNELILNTREKQRKANYTEVNTPRLMDKVLWETSGHWEKYGEHNYSGTTQDGKIFCVKPMNCPGGILIYNSDLKSYKDLPLRVSEFGKVNRYEASGALHGLFRVREFTQDDAHIYCTEEQFEQECKDVINFILDIYNRFDFKNIELHFADRPEKRIGSDTIWNLAEGYLKQTLENMGIEYVYEKGDGAFYGPKIDFYLTDSLNRKWQCGTLQMDLNLPKRFDMKYIGQDGKEHQPIMLHRALLGSIERFLGILIEHYAGKFPTWLSPIQVSIIPITDRNNEYAEKIYNQIFEEEVHNATNGIRIEKDLRSESMQKKVREAQVKQIPYMVVIGDKEEENNEISIRLRSGEQIFNVKLDKFIEMMKKEIYSRKDFNIEDKKQELK